MKKLTLVFALFVLLLTVPENNATGGAATCVGADPCRACKNCRYCARCSKDGKTCGVCKPKR